MKVSKRTNRLCMGLAVAALVAIFFYQVAYATNESSYKYGWSYADFRHRSACDDTDGDCDPSAVSNCSTPYANSTIVTNQTACIDGFVNSWRSQCVSDLKFCAIQVLEGVFPGHVEDNKTLPTCYAKWDGPGSDDANTLVLPRHLTTEPEHSGNYASLTACTPVKIPPGN
jgi:hypothetical protein